VILVGGKIFLAGKYQGRVVGVRIPAIRARKVFVMDRRKIFQMWDQIVMMKMDRMTYIIRVFQDVFLVGEVLAEEENPPLFGDPRCVMQAAVYVSNMV
jgi:hypothetical protein